MEGLNQLIQKMQQLPQKRRNQFLEENVDVVDLVKLALLSGADVTANRNCAICKAVELGNVEVVKLLIDAGADVTAKENYAIREAAWNGNVEIVKLLINAGANARLYEAMASAVRANNLEIIKLLIESGADANNKKIIDVAIEQGRTEILKFFVDTQPNFKKENNLDNLLSDAVETHHYDTVKFLIEIGANVDQYDGLLLHNAVKKENWTMAKTLIEAGANVKGVLAITEIKSMYRFAVGSHIAFGSNASDQLEVAEFFMDALGIEKS